MILGEAEFTAMCRAVARGWTPASRWHVGDLGWQWPSLHGRRVELWAGGAAWAWLEPGGGVETHVDPARPELIGEVIDWAESVSATTITVMEGEFAGPLRRAGFAPASGPFFRHCLRGLGSLPAPVPPSGFRVRPLRDGELDQRVAVHRAAWRPAWLGRLQVPPADLGDGESSMTTERYRQIMATAPYRIGLDLVVEAPGGGFAASALGWYDDRNRAGLLEPVGTDPRYARRGLGAAVSLACLHALRAAGATVAKVCPRGDAAYPVPRGLYHHIGFRDAGRTVTWQRTR